MNKAEHLSVKQKTNLGSFYTPPHLVNLVYALLKKNIGENFNGTMLEPACGYGAFILDTQKFIGVDIDSKALKTAKKNFPNAKFKNTNFLSKLSRSKLGINKNEQLIIIGNPPYNDVTSKVKNNIKTKIFQIDKDIKTRDLGLSFMLSFAKLKPDYIAVLHPLSYLIKKTNFKVLTPLMQHYELADSLVFNSQEFLGTSKTYCFPIIASVYKKSEHGTNYRQIMEKKFQTLENTEFSISDFDYICKYISKYPSKLSKKSKFQFFAMRDINVLKRSQTFIAKDTTNTIQIPPEKLHYYCYIDIFKDICPKLPYYFGNLDVPFNKNDFENIKDDFLTLSIAKHPSIFAGKFKTPNTQTINLAKTKVQNYFNKLFVKVYPLYATSNLILL